MKTYTLCGSMRFEKEMQEITLLLETKYKINVLQCCYSRNSFLNQEDLAAVTAAHYKKIDISDGIYVVDINGYIGRSVRQEIDYALSEGKEVIYHSKFIKQE